MKHPAPITRAIILGNVAVAVIDVLLTLNRPGVDTGWRQMLSLSPANLLDGAWWEPFTYMWLHAPPVGFWVTHLLFNMMTLWIFGKPMEARLGSVRFSAVYLLGGLAAALAFLGQSWWLAGHTWMGLQGDTQEIIGASGAVLAFIGHSAHIGGLIAGYALARAWRRNIPQPPVLAQPNRSGMEEMAATLAVAGLDESAFRNQLRPLLEELGHGRWRPLDPRERAILRRAHLLV